MSNEKQSMLDAMLKQYADATAPKRKSNTQFDKKNYFSTYLPEGETNLIKRVRVLPTGDATSPFISVHLHSYEVDGQKRKFTCLKKQHNTECPFCEARMQLLATGEDTDKESAKLYNEREYYIVKVIDRDDEAHGPKFWRFPSNYKKDGVYDKILANIRMLKTDIGDVETGRDLFVNIDLVPGVGGRKPYGAVTSVMTDAPSKLSDSAEQETAWLGDKKVWTDVYSTKNYEYLEIVVNDGIPVFNKALDKFVAKGSVDDTYSQNNETKTDPTKALENELEIGGKETESITSTEPVENTYVASVDSEDDNDDLPF